MSTKHLSLALCASLALAAPASAACNATISSVEPIDTIVYDPFDGNTESETFKVEFRNNGNDDCLLSLAIASTTTGSQRFFKHGGDQIQYVVETEGGSTYANNITMPLGAIQLKGGEDRKTTTTVKVRIPAGLIAPGANYADTLTLRLFQNPGSGPVQLGSDRNQQSTATIESRAQVNIAGTAGAYGAFELERLNFGALTTNATRNAVVQVRATRPVAISVSSLNHGQLKHQTIPAAQSIPYAMVLDGSTVNLAIGSTLTRTPPLNLVGANYNMLVTIGDTTNRPAGAYLDRITVNVMPQ